MRILQKKRNDSKAAKTAILRDITNGDFHLKVQLTQETARKHLRKVEIHLFLWKVTVHIYYREGSRRKQGHYVRNEPLGG